VAALSVSVVSCIYGDRYDGFVDEWAAAIAALDPQPDEVIVASDRDREISGARVVVSACEWTHPQAWHLKDAIDYAGGDWAWIVDIDDLAFPDALEGIEQVDASVWQMGFLRSDGEVYTPPQLTAKQFLRQRKCVFTAGSAIRLTEFWRCGGLSDVALQDWALWRRMARHDSTFKASGRVQYLYRRHPETRGELELTVAVRGEHLAEMTALEEESRALA
jgi:glycosyltransferase involved in cell wall biosynthesis